MSCYEWERGEVVIPSDQWVAFRKGIIQYYNDRQDKLFEDATKLHDKLEVVIKGKRGQKRKDTLMMFLENELEIRFDPESHWDIRQSLVKDGKLKRPKKKDFPHKPLSKAANFECGDLSVWLYNKDRSLSWYVSENNHARERARDSWLGGLVMRRLRGVSWKRGTGGYFTGNDEYNRDDDSIGGGGNYLTERFGPVGEKAGHVRF